MFFVTKTWGDARVKMKNQSASNYLQHEMNSLTNLNVFNFAFGTLGILFNLELGGNLK